MKKNKVAVVGATGLVGRTILGMLEPLESVGDIHLLASSKSAGTMMKFRSVDVVVEDLATFDPSGIDVAFFSAGGEVSRQFVPKFANSGVIVIDNTSFFRYDGDVPLVVPEINPHHLPLYKKRNIIANPNCSTIQMLLAVAPIHERFGVKNINVATYQAVSGAGQAAVECLVDESREFLATKMHSKSPNSKMAKPIGFNVIPQIDVMRDDGFTKEEWKMNAETRKMLDPSIDVVATCVRVPVINVHSEAIFLETRERLPSIDEIYQLYDGKLGVVAKREGFDTPIDVDGKDDISVSRIRKATDYKLALWCVGDNLRKGAALNAVQIYKKLVELGLI